MTTGNLYILVADTCMRNLCEMWQEQSQCIRLTTDKIFDTIFTVFQNLNISCLCALSSPQGRT